MMSKLKRYPMIRLTLALAAAYVLAHVVIRAGESFYLHGFSVTTGTAPIPPATPVKLDMSKAIAITPRPTDFVAPSEPQDPVKEAKRRELLKMLDKDHQ